MPRRPLPLPRADRHALAFAQRHSFAVARAITGASARPNRPARLPRSEPSAEPEPEPVGIKNLRAGGGKVTFTANAAGRVEIRIRRLVAGRRKGKSCVAAGRAGARAKPCSRRIPVRTLHRPIEPGRNTIKLGKLHRGRYLIDVAASAGGSRAVEASLTVNTDAARTG